MPITKVYLYTSNATQNEQMSIINNEYIYGHMRHKAPFFWVMAVPLINYYIILE